MLLLDGRSNSSNYFVISVRYTVRHMVPVTAITPVTTSLVCCTEHRHISAVASIEEAGKHNGFQHDCQQQRRRSLVLVHVMRYVVLRVFEELPVRSWIIESLRVANSLVYL
jgi:hypothetical protein